MMRDVLGVNDCEVVFHPSLSGEQVLPGKLPEMSSLRFSRSSWQANLSSGR